MPISLLFALLALPAVAASPQKCGEPLLSSEPKEGNELAQAIRENYVKYEYRIPMRDGVKLYTVAFVPRNRNHTWPIMLTRTPYGVNHGVDTEPDVHTQRLAARFSPSTLMVKDGYIFVHQDVRGKLMSEGQFVDVRPNTKSGPDESTDAYDTIDFLVKNVPANNGKVGAWGVSYPGFYAAQAAINAHPALKAVSPQAPVTDWFEGDDFHHHGALFLLDTVSFFSGFGKSRPTPTRKSAWGFDYNTGDSYEFFLNLGPLSNVNARYFKGEIAFWNDLMAHPTRDAFWKARDPRSHYSVSKTAVLTVGGLFDAEDLWGAFATYRAFRERSPGADVRLVMGPWRHGGWSRTEGDKLGEVSFKWKTSRFYVEKIEFPFFQKYLKGCVEPSPANVYMFETGTNLFETLDQWPPKDSVPTKLYFAKNGGLTSKPATEGSESWVSDVTKPVPFRSRPLLENDGEYMVDDQRFAASRPDVLVHQTAPLEIDVTLAGPIDVSLEVATTGTDADFVVKLVDVYPFDTPNPNPNPSNVVLGGFQQLVRGDVFRGRFRTGFETPSPFVPGQLSTVKFTLPDVSHTFRAGHRLMIQVQSSWFPLVDLNPQTYVNPAQATASDFQSATHRIDFPKTFIRVPLRRGKIP